MGLLNRSADFTDRDLGSLRIRAKSLLASTFPDWTDTDVANAGNYMVDMFCWIGDVLGFYQDNQALESKITTALQRKNMLALVKAIGYTPTGAAAAQSTVTFTLSAPVVGGRTVTFNPPAVPTPSNPTTAATNDASNPQPFQLIGSPVVITAGNTTGVGTMENSTLQGPETTASTGSPGQTVKLSRTPYLDNSAIVTASDGSYSQVSNFLQSTSTDRHYTVSVDENDVATLTFGNGSSGKIPVGTISVTYKTGGGADGTVIANGLTLQGNYVDSSGAPVTVTITSTAATGTDRQSIEEIREQAPLSLTALTRTVARTDFEAHATEVAGIERAAMLTRNEDPSVVDNTGNLLLVPVSLGFTTQAQRNAVLAKLGRTGEKPCTVGFQPNPTDPVYLDIGVKATIFLKQGYVATAVRDAIRQAVIDLFALRITNDDGTDGGSNPLVDFGVNLKGASGSPTGFFALSDVLNAVRDVDGVLRVGAGATDFQLSAYRVVATTTGYTSGIAAVLVQSLSRADVPLAVYDFPRAKVTTVGLGISTTTVDVDLTIDGTPYPPG